MSEQRPAPAGAQRPALVPPPRWSRWIGSFLAHVLWRTEVIGAERVPAQGPVVLVANHTGLPDGPVLFGVAPRPSHILVKEEMFVGPVGWVLRRSGQIPVNREDGGRAALAAGRDVLRRGGVVAVFPEGARGRGDAASARAGAAWLAVNGSAAIVPVAVLGTRRTGESVNAVPPPRRRLVVEFGPAFTVERPAGTSGRDAIAHANALVRTALAAVVADAVERSGVALPEDDPQRTR